MNKMNFDSLTNIKAPEHFIENALKVPQMAQAEKQQKKPLLFIKHSRTLAAVACIIFVSVLSVVLYLSSDRTTVKVDPNYADTQSVSNSETKSTANSVTESQSKATENKSNNRNEAVVLPTQPYEIIEPTEGQVTNPTQGETQKPDIIPTLPTQEETEKPKPDTPTVTPIKPTQEWTEPTVPTEGWVEPTESDDPLVPAPVYFTASLQETDLPDGTKIYCKVYDPHNNLIGDKNLYSTQHQAYYFNLHNLVNLTYELSYDYIEESGIYTYYFYNQYGDILYKGTQYI